MITLDSLTLKRVFGISLDSFMIVYCIGWLLSGDRSNPFTLAQSLLGSRTGMLEDLPSTKKHTNGHVARNVRLSLALIDLVEPYVQWKLPDHFTAGVLTVSGLTVEVRSR